VRPARRRRPQARQSSTHREAEIEQLLARAAEANRRGDVQALADLHHPNANNRQPSGEAIVGRAAIARHLETLFEMIPEDIESEPTDQWIHLVTPDVAIIDVHVRNYRRLPTGEREALSDEGFTVVAVREAGEWLLAAVRGALMPKT
jgi:uncharacterized protein (TIGR02246 family)